MDESSDAPQLFTPEETAERLRLTPEHVRRLLRSGELPGIKIGTAWRVDARELSQWVEAHKRTEQNR